MALDCLMPAESGDSVRLLIARHGETRDNASGRWQGWNDSPLTEKGVAQAAELARHLADERIAAVYASDLGRAAHTARLAMPHLDVASHLSPALRERNVGVFSGLTGPEVEARHADALGRRPKESPSGRFWRGPCRSWRVSGPHMEGLQTWTAGKAC